MSAVAYSYMRFSSPKHSAGDSIRRQTSDREKWLRAHPDVSLDTSLVLEDRGRSGFKRDNWETYALSRFVDCIKSGRAESGSYLLVENLDRLSREEAGVATELFLSIVNKGITVVQLSPEVTTFRKPVDMLSLMRAILELSRGHSESAIKSERCRSAWFRKNTEAASRIVTRTLPRWIEQSETGQLVLNHDAARTVRRIFRLARDGHSVRAIAAILNEEGVPVMGRRVIKGRSVAWGAPNIRQMLTSRAVLGEYQPYLMTRRADKPTMEAIPNYYPSVVDESTYHAARAALATRSQVGRGRRGKHVNIFAGLLVDARDGGSICYSHRASGSYLQPVAQIHTKRPKWVCFPAVAFEDAILDELQEVKAGDVEGDRGKAGENVEKLAGEYAGAEQKVAWYKSRCDAAKTEDEFGLFAGKVIEWERKRKDLAAKLAKSQRDAASPLAESLGEFKSLAALLKKDNSPETRTRVRATLRRAIESIHCLLVTPGESRGASIRLAAVQVQFFGGASRHFVLRHHRCRGNQSARRPGRTEFLNARFESVGPIDLRRKAEVEKVARLMMRLADDLG